MLLSLGCSLLAASVQAANPSSTTLTSAYATTNVVLEIPGEDSYDWWGSFYRNMVSISTHVTAVQASTGTQATLLGTLGSSTNTIRTDVSALQTLTGTLGSSTDTLAGIVSTLGSSSNTARTDITVLQTLSSTLGSSTNTLAGRLDAVATSTTNLASIKASSGTNADITELSSLSDGGLKDGSIYGQDIAASTIPVSALNQSGASSSQVLSWNGSAWAPATAGGEGNTFTSTKTYTEALAVGGVSAGGGTLVVKSTSTTALAPIADFKKNDGTSVFNVTQNGNAKLAATGALLMGWRRTSGTCTANNPGACNITLNCNNTGEVVIGGSCGTTGAADHAGSWGISSETDTSITCTCTSSVATSLSCRAVVWCARMNN